MMDIKEKSSNNYTFHKMNGHTGNGASQPKTVLPPETTGTNSPLLYGFRLSQFLTEDAYTSNDNLSVTTIPKRRYTYSVY